MGTNFAQQLLNIKSFIELKQLYLKWIEDGVIQDKADLLQLGYASLIVYPSLYLKPEGTTEELEAAKECYEICLKYGKNDIARKLKSEDNNVAFATKLLTLPPEKIILTKCTEFFDLHYLLKGMYNNKTEKELSQIPGEEYLKVWLKIFDKGFHFEPTAQNIEIDGKHCNESLRIISKMQLSEIDKDEIKPEKLKDRFKDYYSVLNNNKNNKKGCIVLLIIGIIMTSIMAISSI